MHMIRNARDLDIDLWGALHDAEGGASVLVFNNGDGVLVDRIEGHEFDLLIALLQRVLQQCGLFHQLFPGWHELQRQLDVDMFYLVWVAAAHDDINWLLTVRVST